MSLPEVYEVMRRIDNCKSMPNKMYMRGCPPDRCTCFGGGDPSGKDCPHVEQCFGKKETEVSK